MLKAFHQWRHQRRLRKLAAQAQASLALQRMLEPIERDLAAGLGRVEGDLKRLKEGMAEDSPGGDKAS